MSFSDSDGVVHGVDVEAESLYETVGVAVGEFREDDVCPLTPVPTAEFTVAVYRKPTEHKIRLQQVLKSTEPTTKEGPARITSASVCDIFLVLDSLS